MFGQKDREEVLGKNLLLYIFLPCHFSAQQLVGDGRELPTKHVAWEANAAIGKQKIGLGCERRYQVRADMLELARRAAESQRWSCTDPSVPLSAIQTALRAAAFSLC